MRLLLGVCGSISAYKTYDLARQLIKYGHALRVVLTPGALKFVSPEVYRYLGVEQVYLDQDDFSYPRTIEDAPVLHVELAKWCERLVIAPLSANTLADLAMGKAQGLLPSVFLALPKEKPVLLFPAMNTHMLHHTFVQDNFNLLKRFELHPNCTIAATDSGLLACGDTGEGKLMDVEQIAQMIHWSRSKPASNPRRVLITTGATKAYLDPVRYITNPSSGRTGVLLAAEFSKRGDKVELIASSECHKTYPWIDKLPDITVLHAETTHDVHELVKSRLPESTHYFSPAALSDFSFLPEKQKMKKQQLGQTIELKPAPDVLADVLRWRTPQQKVIGFAAETDLGQEVVMEKLERKPVDVLVATKVHAGVSGSSPEGFGQDQAYYKIYVKKTLFHEGVLGKEQLANLLAGELL